MKDAIIYWSITRNTKKVAFGIKEALEESGVKVLIKKTTEFKNINFFDYDLVGAGFPSYQWHPPEAVDIFFYN